MMFLTEVNTWNVVKKQYGFKLLANVGAFTSLLITQILAFLLSFAGVGSMGASSDWYSISVNQYSADMIIAFTMIWGIITSILITTKAYRYDDFTFVSNRLTSNLSNILFLVTASITGGVTSMLLGGLLKAIKYFRFGADQLISTVTAPFDLVTGMFVASLYVLLLSSLGYFVGTLCQVSRIFVYIIPFLFFSVLFFGGVIGIGQAIQFFSMETSLFLFTTKVFMTVVAFFYSSILISKRLEVR
jgi:hypothetical protein